MGIRTEDTLVYTYGQILTVAVITQTLLSDSEKRCSYLGKLRQAPRRRLLVHHIHPQRPAP